MFATIFTTAVYYIICALGTASLLAIIVAAMMPAFRWIERTFL